MKMIKRYWLWEAALFLVAIGGLALALTGTINAKGNSSSDESYLSGDAAATGAMITTTTALDRDVVDDGVVDNDVDNDTQDDIENEDCPDRHNAERADQIDEEESTDDDPANEGEEDFPLLEATAKLLGVPFDNLEKAMANGKSIAQIASANEFNVVSLTQMLIAQQAAFIDNQVRSGNVSAEEAALWKAEEAAFTKFFINTPYVEPEIVAAQTIGIDIETFFAALDEGQSIRAVAEANNVPLQSVIDAVLAAETTYADQLLAADLIDAEEHSGWLAELRTLVAELVNE